MAYEIRLDEKAEADLNNLPVWLQGPVENHLVDLANKQSVLGRKAVSPPYPPDGMISEKHIEIGDRTSYQVTIFYHFSQDETSLIIRHITKFRLS